MTSALALLLAQVPEAGKGSAPAWVLQWQPVFTVSLSALGVVFSIMAYRRAGIRDYRVPVRDFIIARIAAVKSAAEEARRLIEENLSGQNGGNKISHRNALAALKNLQIEINQLEKALPCRKDQVYRAWHDWQQVTTGGCFPITRKAGILPPGDAHLTTIQTAHSQFIVFLAEIELGCLKEKIPFWKRLKATR